MTTKSKEGQEAKQAETPTGTNYYHIDWSDSDEVSKGSTMTTTASPEEEITYSWFEHESKERKVEIAVGILNKLLDFNLDQLSRTDTDTVLVYDEPAKFAASLVNELYENIK